MKILKVLRFYIHKNVLLNDIVLSNFEQYCLSFARTNFFNVCNNLVQNLKKNFSLISSTMLF